MFKCFITKPSLTVVLRQQMAQIKTFAFLDLETTGLPFLESNKTKITELTVLAVHSEHLAMGVVPRVQNKLSLCFNPLKSICSESERITGLSNCVLEHLAPFTSCTVHLLNTFLDHSPKPICLVAHNGNKFDYPILRTEIDKTGGSLLEDVLCIDSLEAFRELHVEEKQRVEEPLTDTPDSTPLEFQDGFDEILCNAIDEYENDEICIKRAFDMQKVNETTPKRPANYLQMDSLDLTIKPLIELGGGEGGCSKAKKSKVVASRKRLNYGVSFKLADVYQRLTHKNAENAHQAENDVVMLAMCAATLGDGFVNWANRNTRHFVSVPMMVPGKKIGT